MSEIQSEKKQEISKECSAEVIDAKRNEEVKQVVAQVISEFSGPIPPPSIIRGYEDIMPGAADRILKMAEIQSAHRQELEKKMVESEARDSLLGVVFAFMLGLGCLACGSIIVINVPESAGAISGALLGATGIGSLTASFLKSTRSSYNRSDSTKKDSEKEDKK